jgi:serine/threonine protein kinase
MPMLAPDTLLQKRYLILRQLGQGGMGAVYQARDERLGSTVVLKKTFFSEARLLKAFEGEARLLANLRHARLPLVMDYFIEGDGHFLVRQFIPGQDLEGVLCERQQSGLGPLPLDQVLLWADQLLDALEYLHWHEPPIVHRDIKPQNLKRTPEGNIVLLDFGLAKGAAAGMSQASPSLHAYTRAYAPLEQIQGAGTDPRSDLYSLAATLHHLLTGQTPPDAVTRATALVKGEPDPLQPANELNSRVPGAIAAVFHRAMAQNPNQRPPSATAMRQALREARQQAPTLVDALLSQPQAQPPRPGDGRKTSSQPPADPGATSPLTHPPTTPDARATALQEAAAALPTPRRSWLSVAFNLAIGSKIKIAASFAIGAMMLVSAVSVYRFLQLSPETGRPMGLSSAPAPSASSAPARIEVMRYFLELEQEEGGTNRVAGTDLLTVSQFFKFHFTPRERGYLYLIAPNEKNVPTTFLTAQPTAGSGVKTNEVAAGADYSFPSGKENWMGLALGINTTTFTIIFSPVPLNAPSFLAQQPGRELTASEQRELEAFQQRYETEALEVKVDASNNQSVITVPADRSGSDPLIFSIHIRRQ